MSRLLLSTKLIDVELSIRTCNVITNSLNKLTKDITIAELIDNIDLVFDNRNCTKHTRKEIIEVIVQYILKY